MDNEIHSPVRLVLLDDRDLVRGRARAVLTEEPLLWVVGDTCDSKGAVELARDLRPDAILVDMHDFETQGLEAIASLSALDGMTRPAIVAYLEIIHRDHWTGARAAGADDLLLKEMPPLTLARELRRIVDRFRSAAIHPPFGSVTPIGDQRA